MIKSTCKLKLLLLTLFSWAFVVANAQIKVEAENYTAVVDLHPGDQKNQIQTENQGKSVGYFDEAGEKLTYSMTVAETGFYEVTLRTLSGNPGTLDFVLGNGDIGLVSYSAVTVAEWWKVPFTDWLTTTVATSPLFYLEAGTVTFSVVNRGAGVNLDYYQFTKATTTNTTLSKIAVNPSNIELMPNEKLKITVSGYTSDNKMIASTVVWSTNAPEGLYSSGGSVGVDKITVKVGSLTKDLNVRIALPEKQRDFVVSTFGQLEVKNGAIRGQKNGEKASFSGPSLFWSCSAPYWWKKETIDWLVDDWYTQIVRCPVSIAPGLYEGGTFSSYNPTLTSKGTWNKNNFYHSPEYAKAMMDEVVKAAIENDIYVIIDFHEHYAEQLKDRAIAFFDYFSKKWGNYPNVIYEVFNEPFMDYQVTNNNYVYDVMATIRKNDPDNVIIVGSGRYSRNVGSANGIASSNANVACTWHGYVEWGHQGDWQGSWGNGVPVAVTEWGRGNGGDDGGIVNNCKSAGVINCPWSLNNKQDGGDDKWSAFPAGYTKSSGWTDNEMNGNGRWMKNMMRNYGYTPSPRVNKNEVKLTIGENQTIYLPKTGTTLSAVATTGNGTIEYTWTQISGPKVCTISDNKVASPVISNLVLGKYVFGLSATNNLDTKDGTVTVTVLPEGFILPVPGEVVDNVDDNDTVTLWGGFWASQDDNSKKGLSVITKTSSLPNSKTIKAIYTLDKGGWQYDPFCGLQMKIKTDGSAYDLTKCTQITYRFKGSAHDFRVEMSAVVDDDFHNTSITASTDWKTVSVDWGSLAQETGWGADMDLDKKDIKAFSWQVKGATGDQGSLEIDDVTCVGATGPQGGKVPPIVYAGADFTTDREADTLNGSLSFDLGGSPLTYTWSQVSGPSTATIASPKLATSLVSGLVNGVYLFSLSATNGREASADTVKITVNQVGTTQTISLSTGWNMISFNVVPTDKRVATLFPNATVVKNNEKFFKKDMLSGLISLTELVPGEAYLVFNSKIEDVVVKGAPLPVTTKRNLVKGWNLVGVRSQTKVTLPSGLPTQTIIVKDFNGFYMPNSTLGQIKEITPGSGYFIKVSDNCQVDF